MRQSRAGFIVRGHDVSLRRQRSERPIIRPGRVKAPFLLFVPSYGNGGSGEFVRSVALAQAAQRRWPGARIEFLLPGGPGTRQDAPFPKICHDGPEDSKGAFDREHLQRLRPDVAIFDSACRSPTLRLCRQLGIRSAYISDREGTCRKAFRLDWLRTLDAHWHQREHVTGSAFTAAQRLKMRLSSTHRKVFDTYFPEQPADWNTLPEPLRERLAKGYVLFSPGGGGYRIDGRPVSEMFLDAAERVHAAHGVECLSLLGSLYEGNAASTRTSTLRQVPQELFLELMRRARVVVTNGGHTLHQALACGAVCVTAPLGGDDQPGRIAAYARAGLVRASAPKVDALVDAVGTLLEDSGACAAQRRRALNQKISNGIPLMLDAIAELISSPP